MQHVEHFDGTSWVGRDGLSAPVYTDAYGSIENLYRVCVDLTSRPGVSCTAAIDFWAMPGECTGGSSGGGGSRSGGKGECRGKVGTTGCKESRTDRKRPL